jgi:hypothetical protein
MILAKQYFSFAYVILSGPIKAITVYAAALSTTVWKDCLYFKLFKIYYYVNPYIAMSPFSVHDYIKVGPPNLVSNGPSNTLKWSWV